MPEPAGGPPEAGNDTDSGVGALARAGATFRYGHPFARRVASNIGN